MDKNPEYTKLIKRRHPEYEDRVTHWDFCESCYEGGRDWFEDNIFQYYKEGSQEYADRVERAYRFNHSREVVDLLDKYLFRGEVTRNDEDAGEEIKNFWRSSTKAGGPIESLTKRTSKATSIFGRVYVVVDTNARDGAISIADAKQMDTRAYAYIVKPQDALDMSFDDYGQLNWILIREYARDDANPLSDATDVYPRYRLWTRTGWMLFKEEKSNDSTAPYAVLVDRGDHGLGIVPVIAVDHIEDENPYFTPALINDIAYLDRAVANYLSNLDAIIQDQTFSQLAMPAQALPPGEEAAVKDKLIELGTKRIFLYNGEGGAEPKFLSPDPRQAELLITAIRTIINEIYHTVGLAGERTKQDNSMGIDNSSGVAKAYDFDRVNALLAAKAEMLERFERRLVQVVGAWNSQKLTEEELADLVKYPRNFDVRSLLNEFEIAARLSLVQAPDSVRSEQMRMLVEKLFPALPKELKDKMLSDIAAWPQSARDQAMETLKAENEMSADNTDMPKRPTQGSKQSDDSADE